MIAILNIIKTALQSAILNSKDYPNLKMKSSEFIKCLHRKLEEYYKDNKEIVVFSKEITNTEFSRNEYLYDILVAEKEYTFSEVHKKKIPYIKKAVIELESEFERNAESSIIDFSKLMCGQADYKIMVLPFTKKLQNYLGPLKDIAINDPNANTAIAFIDHPSNWSTGIDPRFKTFKFEANEFKEIN